MKISKRIQDLANEMTVHGTEAALQVLASKYTADEIIVAARVATARRQGWSTAQAARIAERIAETL